MASISKDANGNVCVQFVAGDKRRRSIRLGKVNAKVANEIKLKVESLNALAINHLPMDANTAAWVAGIGNDLAAKLAAVGLIPERQSAKLGKFLEDYIVRRGSDSKGGTVTNLVTVRNDVVNFFKADTDLRDITEQRADDFRTHYLTRKPKLAAATVARRLKTVRLFFKHAMRMKLISVNPFADVTAAGGLPADRQHYITAEDTAKLLTAANPIWRIVIALTRFAGLRNPSEVLSLKWEHVNFETNRMTVPSPKTEHHPGKAYRTVPLFPELRPYLDEAFELAAEGAVYVVGGPTGDGFRTAADRPGGWMNANMRTTFLKIVRRAGLRPWPRLFHNLRASCETDLMKNHPIHCVCSWLGNTPTVALRHYLQVVETDFERAITGGAKCGAVVVQNAVQSEVGGSGQKLTEATETLPEKSFRRLVTASVVSRPVNLMGDTGFEPVTSSV
jgi:integrase